MTRTAFFTDKVAIKNWLMKKNPTMGVAEIDKRVEMIYAKHNKPKAPKMTMEEIRDKVENWIKAKYPNLDISDYNEHYKEALLNLGFSRDGYDEYGTKCFSDGTNRVAVYYDHGDFFWDMEIATTYGGPGDNFYNTTSETHDLNGRYGWGSECVW